MNIFDIPDEDRPLILCDECGKYTESLLAHAMGGRCVKTAPTARPRDRRIGVRLAKLPVGPLIEAAGPGVADAARRLRVPRRSLQRWKTDGIPWDTADMLAVRFGMHPGEIWHEWAAFGLADSAGEVG